MIRKVVLVQAVVRMPELKHASTITHTHSRLKVSLTTAAGALCWECADAWGGTKR